MRARIATVITLVSVVLVVMGPARAEECALADQILAQCPTETNPLPEPQPEPQPEAQPSPPPAHQPAAVTRLLTLLNQERQTRGLVRFTLRDDVSAQSRKHSEAMAARGTIWHNDAYFTAANKQRLGAVLLGENVARNPDIDDAHRRLMNSPGHKANVVDGRFSVIGLAVYRSSTGSLYVTESFLQPVTAKVAAVDKPRSAPTPPPAPTTTVAADVPPAPEPAPEPAPAPAVLGAGPWPDLAVAPVVADRSPSGRPPLVPLAVVAVMLLAVTGLLVRRYAGAFAHNGVCRGPSWWSTTNRRSGSSSHRD